HREIAVEHGDLLGSSRSAHLPCRTLDDRTESDLVPVIGKDVAHELFETSGVGCNAKTSTVVPSSSTTRCGTTAVPMPYAPHLSAPIGCIDRHFHAAENAQPLMKEADRILVVPVG